MLDFVNDDAFVGTSGRTRGASRGSTCLAARDERRPEPELGGFTQPRLALADWADFAAQADFEFKVAYEVIPAIEIKDVSGIKVTREVVETPDSEVDEQILKIADSARTYTEKSGKAENGDRAENLYDAAGTEAPNQRPAPGHGTERPKPEEKNQKTEREFGDPEPRQKSWDLGRPAADQETIDQKHRCHRPAAAPGVGN